MSITASGTAAVNAASGSSGPPIQSERYPHSRDPGQYRGQRSALSP